MGPGVDLRAMLHVKYVQRQTSRRATFIPSFPSRPIAHRHRHTVPTNTTETEAEASHLLPLADAVHRDRSH